jgi:hypothetical protein
MNSTKVQLKLMESRKKEKPLSELSYSDSELDMIDWDASSLSHHSHFFAPSGHPHNRYSTPLILISPGHSGHGSSMDINSSRSSGGLGGGGGGSHSSYTISGAAAMNTQTSSGSSSGAPSPGPFPRSTSRSKLIVPPAAAMNGHFEGEEEEGEGEGEDDKRRANGGSINGWPRGRLYVNKDSLAHDLSFLANMPELCDVTFLVGDDRQPICAVRAILAARSR